MRIVESIDELRTRFRVLRGNRDLGELAKLIGISRPTLASWVADDHWLFRAPLEKIEEWVEIQESGAENQEI